MTTPLIPAEASQLLLVGGCGRSGTTFIQGRLAKCSDISGVPDFESKLFTEPASIPDLFDFYVFSYTQSRFDWIADIFVSSVERNFALLPEADETGPITSDGAAAAAREFISNLYRVRAGSIDLAGTFRKYSTIFLNKVLLPRPATWMLEKTPHNVLQFGRVLTIYPSTKLIHVVRDPRRIAESLTRQEWFGRSFEEAVIWVRLFYEQYFRLRSISEGFYTRELVVRLEDCADLPEIISRRITNFLNIDEKDLHLHGDFILPNPCYGKLTDEQFSFANSQLSSIIEDFGYNLEVERS